MRRLASFFSHDVSPVFTRTHTSTLSPITINAIMNGVSPYARKKLRGYRKGLGHILAVVAGLIIALHQPPAGLSGEAMQVLGILVWAILAWVLELFPDYVVSLTMCTGSASTSPMFLSASYMGYVLLGILPVAEKSHFNWLNWFIAALPWLLITQPTARWLHISK